MKNFKRFLSVLMILTMLVPMFSTSLAVLADTTPVLTVENNAVSITNSDSISYIRYAAGVYADATSLKNAADCVTLNASAVAERSANGVFSVKFDSTGTYTFWVKTSDGTTQMLYAEIVSIEPTVSANGVMITVDNLHGAQDFFIAKGTYTTYREVKDNLVVQITSNKLNGATKYTYTVKDPGDYTVLVRYTDTEKENWIDHITLTVTEPVYTDYGLQVKIANLEGIKVIRAAYGDYASASEIKKAEGARGFSAKTIGAKDPYTVQFRENGLVTIAVVYNNGYVNIHQYEVTKRVPTVVQEDKTVTFGDLDELQNIRYAPGEYNTSAAIKNAEGSQTIKNTAIVDGVIKLTLEEAGVYSFCVQYKDESYNYYQITIEDEVVPDPEPEIPETATATGVGVSNAFSNNMVVQRDQSMSVWGTADEASGYVFVEFAGETAIAEVAEDGTWKATFDKTFAYNTEGQSITVKSAEEDIVIEDVLIGDVYYIIGQSNVFYNVQHIITSLAERGETLTIDYKDTRNIRFFHISSTDYADATGDLAQGTPTVYTDVTCGAKWQTPSQVGGDVAQNKTKIFSALGYLFAYNLSNSTDIPIGVIEADASGMALTSFAPNHLAEKWGQEAYDELGGTYHYKLGVLEQSEIKSRFVYNQQIHPMTGFSLAGMLWYQGESDHYNNRESHGIDYPAYPKMFTELMEYYRDTFGNGTYDFPVYMIELPSCYSNGGANAFIDYGLTRAEMGTIPQLLDDCYIASCSDLWFDAAYWNNVHPPIKHLQAIRLAEIVLAHKYDETILLQDVHGPVLNNVVYNGNTATLTFDYTGSGLAPAHPTILGTELQGIQVKIYENGFTKWVDVTGEQIVNGNQIVINHTSKIYGVRYNAQVENHFPYIVNLCNSYGMPAIAFVDYCLDPLPEFDVNQTVGTATNVTVSSAFTSNMIVQRDERLRVWGTADASSGVVRVDFAGEVAVANVTTTGTWEATFDKTFSYNTEGQQMIVSGANFTKVFDDVLIGDVYYIIGQSNVFYSMAEMVIDYKMKGMSATNPAVDYDDNRDMRFFRISNTDYIGMTGTVAQGTTVEYTDVYHGKAWQKPSDVAAVVAKYMNLNPTSVFYDRTTIAMESFSALGYMFAYNMTNCSEVPVGVIEIDASGHPLITFAPNELADKWGHDRIDASGRYYYYLNEVVYNTECKSRYAYNQQIAPLSRFSTAGVIWYQGESDLHNTREVFGDTYTNSFADQFAELMTYYRNHFGNNDFPVYIMEFPACFDDSGTSAYMDIGGVRAELGTIPQKLDNCHIISTSDMWYDTMWLNNIHSYAKDVNALRLAQVVMSDKFGSCAIDDVAGPVVKDVIYEGTSKAYIQFDNEGEGLTTADGTGTVKGIEVCILYDGAGLWLPHEGQIITGTNQITVDVGSFQLLGVRYNRQVEAYYPGTVNLCNSAGIPAVAFVDYPNQPLAEYAQMSIDESGWDIYTPRNYTDYNYRYGPAFITNEDGSIDAWFSSTGSNASEELDYFTYKHSEDGGKTWGDEKIVLSPTGLSKDRLSVCDPAIVYFNGYYYLGYTSTLDTAGYANHGFVARSTNPDGPYEKWNGNGWGGSPEPFIYYNGRGDQWGMGELSFTKVGDTLYIYYSVKTENGCYTYVTTADATSENWPATVAESKKAFEWLGGQAGADVKYDTAAELFVATALVASNTESCYVAVYTSEDGYTFCESNRTYNNLKVNAMNNGITAGPDGTFNSSEDQVYFAYSYGENWGCWATRLAPVTFTYAATPIFTGSGARDTETFVAAETEIKNIGITTEQHFYVVEEGETFNVVGYMFNDEMARSVITDNAGFAFSAYDSSIVSFNGMQGTALGVGKTVVTLTYNDTYYVTFTVDVRAKGSDTTSAAIYSWEPTSDVITISCHDDFMSCIRGVAITNSGIIGEAFNDHNTDKAIFQAADYPVTFSGYDTSVISIVHEEGWIRPMGQGTTNVTVTIGGTVSFTVTVKVI